MQCLNQLCRKCLITGVFRVIALVTLGITILTQEKAYSQPTHKSDLYLTVEDYRIEIQSDDSLIIFVLTDSIANRMQVDKDVIVHLRDEKGRVVIAGRMGLFDAAFPSGCNFYFYGTNRDIGSRKKRYTLKQIPLVYQKRGLLQW